MHGKARQKESHSPQPTPLRTVVSVLVWQQDCRLQNTKKTRQECYDGLTRPVADSCIKRSTYNSDIAADWSMQ